MFQVKVIDAINGYILECKSEVQLEKDQSPQHEVFQNTMEMRARIVDIVNGGQRLMDLSMSRRDFEQLPYREDLKGTPIDGLYYRVRGEPKLVVQARLATDGFTVSWDAFGVGFNVGMRDDLQRE